MELVFIASPHSVQRSLEQRYSLSSAFLRTTLLT